MTNVIANEIFLKRRNNIRQGHFWRNCCKNKKIKEFLKNVDAIHPCPLIRQFLKIGGLQTINNFGTIRQKLCKSRYQIFSVFSTFLDSFTVCQIFCLGLQDDFFVKYQVYFWFCLIFSVKWNPLLHGGFQKRTHADFTS